MALDFKSMSTEKKIALCGAAVAALFGLVAFILSLVFPATEEGIIKTVFSGGSFASLNCASIFLFFAMLGVAAIQYVKAAPSKLVPMIPMKLVAPAVIALTGLFAMLYFQISMETGGFLDGRTVLGVFLIIFAVLEIAVFALSFLENKDIPTIILLAAAVLLLILTIIALASTGDGGIVAFKLFYIFHVVAILGYAGFVCFKEIKE